MDRETINRKQKQFIYPAIANYFSQPLAIDRGEMQHVWDVDGRRYLDFFGGILTVGVGHANPRITGPMKAQIDKLQHTSTLYQTQAMVDLAEKIAQITPGTPRKELLHLQRQRGQRDRHRLHPPAYRQPGDHRPAPLLQRTHLADQRPERHQRLAQDLLSDRHRPRDEPLLLPLPARQDLPLLRGGLRQGHRKRHSGQHLRSYRRHDRRAHPGGRRLHHAAQRVLQDGLPHRQGVRRRLHRRRGPDRLGPHRQKMVRYRALGGGARRHHLREEPRNGVPIGLTIATPEVADSYAGPTIATFGGNPVSCVAAKAVIDLIEEDDLRTNCEVVGGYLREGLLELQRKFPIIGDVRGMGMMQAMELVVDPKTKEPAPAMATALLEAARDNGLLIGKGGMYNNTIRITPPMNVGKSDVDEALRLMELSFAHITAAMLTTA